MDYAPLKNTIVLGLIGKARHGKDSLASALVKAMPGAERFAFSDAISTYARIVGEMGPRDPVMLQKFGYELRQTNPGVWLKTLYWSIADKAPSVAIVTGARFADEVGVLRSMGGYIVRVRRLEEDGTEFVSNDRDPNHAVEREIDGLYSDRDVNIGSGHMVMFDRSARQVARWLDAKTRGEVTTEVLV